MNYVQGDVIGPSKAKKTNFIGDVIAKGCIFSFGQHQPQAVGDFLRHVPVLCGDFLLSFVFAIVCVTGGSRNLWRSTFEPTLS